MDFWGLDRMRATTPTRTKRSAGRPVVRSDGDADEIFALSERSLRDLFERREKKIGPDGAVCRRGEERWPFPGTVEIWVPNGRDGVHYFLATSTNLSRQGIGLRCDEPIVPGVIIELAVHEPELTLHGDAVVRHCAAAEDGSFLLGLQFLFKAS